MWKDDRIEIEPIFLSNAFNVYIMEVLEHFGTKKLFMKTWNSSKFFLPEFAANVPKYILENI